MSYFKSGALSSVDLKPAMAEEVIRFISPLRAMLLSSKELIQRAYG